MAAHMLITGSTSFMVSEVAAAFPSPRERHYFVMRFGETGSLAGKVSSRASSSN